MNFPTFPTFSKISLGTSQFGNGDYKMSYNYCKAIIDKALSNKINYIDTSPYYGDGKAEDMVGKCLKNVTRDRYIISSKAGRNSDKTYSYRYYDIANSVMKSIQRLGCGYIDILFINDIEYAENIDIIIQESLTALLYLKRQGYIKYIGLSGFYLKKMNYVIERSSCIDYVLSYGCYTLINDTLNHFAPGWNSKNIKIIQGGVTNKGLLSNNVVNCNTSVSYQEQDICKKMNDFCHVNKVNIVEKAFYFTLAYKRISTILVGINSVDELEEYMNWLDKEYSNNNRFINTLIEMSKPIKNKEWLF